MVAGGPAEPYIKIPATEAGLPAITETIANGHQRQRHPDLQPRAVPRRSWTPTSPAWRSGWPNGGSLDGIASVASFFVSRVDTEIDKRLDAAGADASLKGKAGIANAQLAYQAYEEVFSSDRWRALEAEGRRCRSGRCGPRPGSRTPSTRDTMYISELIAPGTVNTMPEKTMKAYADHGTPGHAGAEGLRRRRGRR